jgi:SAM-dependent methyltransferase
MMDFIDLEKAERDVNRVICPDDKMFVPGSEDHFFRVGRSALQCIDVSMRAAGKPIGEVRRILDLPCGHGRVLRYLRAAFPDSRVTACDLMRDGVDFCATALDAVPVYSDPDPRKVPIDRGTYDLIWVGSLFTHFDARHWVEFLHLFREALAPGGLLVFTTHGRMAYRRLLADASGAYNVYGRPRTFVLHDYERTGFGYTPYPGCDGPYGFSLQAPSWVLSCLTRLGSLRVVHYAERGWDDHQDCVACVREDVPGTRADSREIAPWRYWKQRLGESLRPAR